MSICLRRRWLALLVCGKIAAACCVFGADSNESTPRVSVGIKVGAPMRRFLTFDSTGGDAHTKHYTIGPAMDIGLHRGFGIEVGAMYKRIDEYSSSLTLLSVAPDTDENCPNCPTYRFNRISTLGRSWEFPVAGQYHISLRSMRPYVEGGLSFNHLSNIYGPLIGPTILGQTEQPSLNSFNRQRRFVRGRR